MAIRGAVPEEVRTRPGLPWRVLVKRIAGSIALCHGLGFSRGWQRKKNSLNGTNWEEVVADLLAWILSVAPQPVQATAK